jgi:hypothetical protein
MNNNRYEIRKAYQTGIEVISSLWDDTVNLMATNVSPEGAFVATDLPLDHGEKVVVSFSLEKVRKEFTFFAEVSRVVLNRRISDYSVSGMGLKFLDAKPFERITIRDAVRRIPPPLPKSLRKKNVRPSFNIPVVFSMV